MEWRFLIMAMFGYAPIGLLVFAPACAILARRRNRDAETWLLLGAVGGPIALAWIGLLPARPRFNDPDLLLGRRQPTPPNRIAAAGRAVSFGRCLLCNRPLLEGHACRPDEVEDRIQRRWTVRVGGLRIISPP